MFHRIRTHLARTLVHVVLPVLARILRAFRFPGPVPLPAPVPLTASQPPPFHRPLRLAPRSRPHHPLDPERRARRTALRLALDGFVVTAGAAQAYSAGTLALATTRRAA
ncbi:hypothetical protein P8A18_15255 [Streptomyces castrisilvae]|uniref:Uncharacterized protein n=1 Tax=Streptomyces castrisilvae TaxID=3033811 RepID=A0ABY9HL18_9ACTN|nr:hypothetical protein [Streptomyces sp. Mut1]WLQ34708.1 hypothetical protein P8A18_15255 [Streptomyces sp. Mut1]